MLPGNGKRVSPFDRGYAPYHQMGTFERPVTVREVVEITEQVLSPMEEAFTQNPFIQWLLDWSPNEQLPATDISVLDLGHFPEMGYFTPVPCRTQCEDRGLTIGCGAVYCYRFAGRRLDPPNIHRGYN